MRKYFQKHIRLFVAVLVGIAGAYLSRNLVGATSIGWMRVYHPSDFKNAGMADVLEFYLNLRIPIPPILSFAEILSTWYLGNSQLITVFGYRFCMVGSFLLAVHIAGGSLRKFFLSSMFAVVMINGVTRLHSGNPQLYDIYFPMFVILYFYFVRRAMSGLETKWGRAWLFLGGFWLSMAELTRPFFFLIVLLLVPATFYKLYLLRRGQQFVYFAIPIIMLSGLWHLHMAVSFGQATWTNHSGYNLQRGWDHVPIPAEIVEKDNAPLGPRRLPNLNTAEHTTNNYERQKAIITNLVRSPFENRLFQHGMSHMVEMLKPRTNMGGRENIRMPFYERSANIATIFLLVNMFIILTYLVMLPLDWRSQVTSNRNWQVVTAVLCLLILGIGESGEEMRFFISVLPLFSAMPESAVVWKEYQILARRRYQHLVYVGRKLGFANRK